AWAPASHFQARYPTPGLELHPETELRGERPSHRLTKPRTVQRSRLTEGRTRRRDAQPEAIAYVQVFGVEQVVQLGIGLELEALTQREDACSSQIHVEVASASSPDDLTVVSNDEALSHVVHLDLRATGMVQRLKRRGIRRVREDRGNVHALPVPIAVCPAGPVHIESGVE